MVKIRREGFFIYLLYMELAKLASETSLNQSAFPL